MDAKEQILSHFPQLTSRLRDAARLILDHANDVVKHSIRGLAETPKKSCHSPDQDLRNKLDMLDGQNKKKSLFLILS